MVCLAIGCYALGSQVLLAQNNTEPPPARIRVSSAPQIVGEPTSSEESNVDVVRKIEASVKELVKRCEPSIVGIARVPIDLAPRNLMEGSDWSSFLRESVRDPNATAKPDCYGSGVVIDSDGIIVTCAHLLGDIRQHEYLIWSSSNSTLPGLRGAKATVLASDIHSGLALLKVESDVLPALTYKPLQALVKGTFVIAIGHHDEWNFDGEANVSWGVISNLNRRAAKSSPADRESTLDELGTLAQTDAKYYSSSNGGALIDLNGRLIGITTTRVEDGAGESPGGFVIVCDEAFDRIIERLKLGLLPEYGFLGAQPDLSQPEQALASRGELPGCRIAAVLPGLPASLAGLKAGDYISAVDDKPVRDRIDLFREVSLAGAGSTVKLHVVRTQNASAGQRLELTTTLSKKPISDSELTYHSQALPQWRGIEVEYLTAIPDELAQVGFMRPVWSTTPLVVRSVQPDSRAWHAGVRPGAGILRLADREVRTPESFYEVAQQQSGPTTLDLLDRDGKTLQIMLAAE